MRDVELIIRYFSFRNLLGNYRGNMKDFLDKACAFFNADWSKQKALLIQQLVELDEAHKTIMAAFRSEAPDYNYGKWVGDRFERRFNRAIFDVLIGTIVQPAVFASVMQDPKKLVSAFKELCANDAKFVEAIERTTKSLESTRYRFQAWSAKLAAALNVKVSDPAIGV